MDFEGSDLPVSRLERFLRHDRTRGALEADSLLYLIAVLCLTVLSVLGLAALSASTAHAASCDGFANYADELVASGFALESETILGDGLSEIELSFEVANVDLADFASLRAFPTLGVEAEALGIEAIESEAEFGAVGPLGVATPTANLRLRLPTANVSTLLDDLSADSHDALPMTVYAEEQNALAPGVVLTSWSASEDAYYAIARDNAIPAVNLDPGPPPYAPGAQFGIVLIALFDGGGSVFDAFDTVPSLYIAVEDYLPSEIPEALHYARVVEVQKSDEEGSSTEASDGVTTWLVLLERTDTESLPDLYDSASFCTGDSTHIDLPVQATRLQSIDGDEQGPEERDTAPQPVHFNDADIDGKVTLSGQLEGHVLRPSLELRLRDGKVRAVVDIETDLSLTVELRAQVSEPFSEELDLFDLCFPLPDLIAGPVPIGLNLQLEHIVGAEGDVRAGAIVGFQKSFRGGHTVGFDGRRARGDRYFSDPHHEQPSPVEFTPPQLLGDTGARVEIYTELRTTLRVGAKYPLCDTGAGGYLGVRARGVLDVRPVRDPWWSLGHEAEVFAGIDLQILGLDIAEHETKASLFPGADTLEAGGPLILTPSAAAVSSSNASSLTASFSAASATTALTSGADQRWGLAIDALELPNGIRHTAVAELADGSVILAAHEKIPGRNPLLRFDRHGVLLSSQKYRDVHAPRQVSPLPDGSFLVAGEPAWVARHAADGTLLSGWDFNVTDTPGDALHCVIGAIAPVEESPGVSGFVAVGHHGRGDVRQRDACAFRVDAAGSLLWAKTYGEDGAQELYDVILTSDGRIAAVGEVELGPTAFSENNPFFLVLDAADGSVIWSRSIPTLGRNVKLNAVAEAPDGTLFGAGGGLRHVSDTGAAIVVRIDADGENPHHGMILQDEQWDADIAAGNFVDTHGGDTAYDEIFDLVATSGGFLIAGSTGLGDEKGAWVGKINHKLGVEWLRSFDGEFGDTLDGVALAQGGYLASGFSGSLRSNLPGDDTQVWLMKLAVDGGADLLDDAGVESRFVSPGVRASSGDEAIVPDGVVSMDAPLVVVDALPDSSATLVMDLLETPHSLCVTRLTGSGFESEADDCDPTPVPEPGVGLLRVGGVLVVAALVRRRRK